MTVRTKIVHTPDSYNTAILQLVVALQVTFMPLQFSRLLIFIVSIPFRWDAIDEMIVITMTGWRRYVLVKYATRGLVQGGSVAPLFNILYALAVATFMAIHLLRTAANILQVRCRVGRLLAGVTLYLD